MERPTPLYTAVIARPEDYIPSSEDTIIIGAFNPGATIIKDPNGLEKTLLMVRVSEAHKQRGDGNIYLPYFEIPNEEGHQPQIGFDIFQRRQVGKKGKKEVKLDNGTSRLRHISLPRILLIDEKGHSDFEQNPTLCPGWEYERFGTEDVRITHVEDGRYIVTYVSPHRDFGVSTAFLETQNFKAYERLPKRNTPRPIITGIKDVVLFPKKVSSPSQSECIDRGEKIYSALVRPNAFSDISIPGIWVAYSPDLVHWGQFHRLTTSKKGEITGTGPPPLQTDNIWLAPYHETTKPSKTQLQYNTRLMSLDAKEPWKDCRTSEILLTRKDYREILPNNGYVSNVVFTSGMTEREGITTLFSGIDDKWSVMDKFYTEDLINFIKKSR